MNMPHRKMSWKVYCPHFTVSWIMDDPERCHTSKLCPPMFLSDFNIHRKTNSKRIFIISDFNKSVMILKSRDITLPTQVHLVKAMVFPVVMYGCDNWTVKKAEC